MQAARVFRTGQMDSQYLSSIPNSEIRVSHKTEDSGSPTEIVLAPLAVFVSTEMDSDGWKGYMAVKLL
jgi:hypothetical protein